MSVKWLPQFNSYLASKMIIWTTRAWIMTLTRWKPQGFKRFNPMNAVGVVIEENFSSSDTLFSDRNAFNLKNCENQRQTRRETHNEKNGIQMEGNRSSHVFNLLLVQRRDNSYNSTHILFPSFTFFSLRLSLDLSDSVIYMQMMWGEKEGCIWSNEGWWWRWCRGKSSL